MPETPSSRRSLRGPALAAVLIAIAGVVSLLGATPTERVQQWGSLVRHADDVTPERVIRFRVAAYALGAAMSLLGLVALRAPDGAQAFIAKATIEPRTFAADVLRWWETLSVPNRISYLLLVATGTALRLNYLNTPMAYDEAYNFTNFARRPLVEALSDYNNTNNHLLNTFFMHVIFRLFGQQEWALRLPVLVAGILLVAFSFPWARARLGAGPALLATALIAASPMLIDYSVNARGYTYMTLLAVVLDGCLMRIALAPTGVSRAGTWTAAGLCIWLGFASMPTFAHPLAGLIAWFLIHASQQRRLVERAAPLAVCLLLSGLATALTYTPAFVFRGTLALQNDFVRPLPLAEWSSAFPSAVWKGVERWIDGGVPGAILLVFAWGGLVAWIRRSLDDRPSIGWGGLAILSMLLVPLALMALQRVAPPPRLFFFQAPWFYLLVATGAGYALGLVHRLKVRLPGDGAMRFFAYAVLAAGVWFVFEHPILREPHQREFGVGSVPAALRRLGAVLDDHGTPARLYAPLPCDHPAIFYAAKFAIAVAVNGQPQVGERLFLLARPADPPESTLRDVVVRQEAIVGVAGPWQKVAEFPELVLWEAARPFNKRDTIDAPRAPADKAP